MSAKKVEIELWEPHKGQQYIIENSKRFNVIPCSRRFGKTQFMIDVDYPLIGPAVFEGWCIGIFTPVRKDFSRQWELVKKVYKPLIHKVDNTKMIIWFHGGGELWVFSLANKAEKNNGRGWPFHRVIYEETQKIPDDVFAHHWKEAIRPTLNDYKGDAYFIGTANGKGNTWHEFCRRGAYNGGCSVNSEGEEDLEHYGPDAFKDWITFRMKTTDNPHMEPEEVEAALEDMDVQSWLQEYFSHFLDFTGQTWAYSLDDLEVKNKIFRELPPIDWTQEIYLGFDFNKIPMTAVIMQKKYFHREKQIKSGYRYAPQFKKSFKLGSKKKGRNKAQPKTIYDTCEAIRLYIYEETGVKIGIWENEFGGTTKYKCPFDLRVTGDASGNVTSGMVKEPKTYYTEIINELGINSGSLFVPKKNPFLTNSWANMNKYIQKCPEYGVDKKACKDLMKDLLTAKDDGKHGIKKASGEQESHTVDGKRYILNTFCKDIKL